MQTILDSGGTVQVVDSKECPYYLMSRSTLAVTARLKQEFAAAHLDGVRPAYLGVLLALWRDDGVIAADLARGAGLEPSTLTGLLDRMARDGLLERAPDPRDRRAQRIRLTERGKQLADPVLRAVDRTLRQVLDGVSGDDLARAKNVLRQVLANTDRAA